jgi:hypothetical protein
LAKEGASDIKMARETRLAWADFLREYHFSVQGLAERRPTFTMGYVPEAAYELS